jgi:uncharacterized protein YbjT (DUF2867 family)
MNAIDGRTNGNEASIDSGERPRILVTGATGAQGGGVARELLARGRFAVRAITRNPDSDRARQLAAAGVEVLHGDLADPSTLGPALAGCYGVFGVTSFWEHFEGEYEHGKNLVEAVAAAGTQHFVFSTLPHIKAITGGLLDVPHFDIKGRLEEMTVALGIPATFVHVAFYYENFIHFLPPRRQEDGSFAFGFPQGDTRLAAVSVEDVGGIVATLFERREEFLGRTVGVVGDDRPPAEYAADMSRLLGRDVRYAHVPREVFAALPFRGADDLANMFEYNRTRLPNRVRDLAESRELNPGGMQTFEDWLARQRDAFEPVFAG